MKIVFAIYKVFYLKNVSVELKIPLQIFCSL